MCLDAALSELGVEIVGHSWSKIDHTSFLSSLFFHFFEFLKFLLLDDVGKFFTYQFKFLLVEDVDGLIQLVVQPIVLKHLFGGGSLLWHFL